MPSVSMQMQSISGIITQIHVTSGEKPPPLVGASVTVVDDRVFVFAGRLVTSRKMTNYMYVLDLKTLEWTRHIPPPDSAKPPKRRYFHSANVYKSLIVVFGGMGYSRISTDGLCVLDDISIFDVETMSWRRPTVEPSLFAPRPRYAHLSTVADAKLVVIGGQDMNNGYLGEINVLDLKTWEWVHAKTFNNQAGAYRSVAITSPAGVRLPVVPEETPTRTDDAAGGKNSIHNEANHSTATPINNSPVYLYTNYNFADVKRELQLICSPSGASSTVEDCSTYMTGSAMPPGIRFPTGYTLGHHLILSGTYLSPQTQAFSIWALDLGTLTWSRIETGSVFGQGSWNRGVLHSTTNRFIVFGNNSRNLLEDYNHRQVNFDHLAFVDLEAFGIYNLPQTTCSVLAQEMGLSLLSETAISDFRIITSENQAIPVNSSILCQRWPYFEELMKTNRHVIQSTTNNDNDNDTVELPTAAAITLRTHSMSLPYPYPVAIALLQFLYTDNLLTAQQYQPSVLSQLLLLADMYNLPRLRELATHALHQMLNMSTAPLIFETAALAHQTSLQVRALKMMIAAKKMIQQQQQQQQQQQFQQSTVSSSSPRDTRSFSAESSTGSTDSQSTRFGRPLSPISTTRSYAASKTTVTSPTASISKSPTKQKNPKDLMDFATDLGGAAVLPSRQRQMKPKVVNSPPHTPDTSKKKDTATKKSFNFFKD